jgi:hypothetical protein
MIHLPVEHRAIALSSVPSANVSLMNASIGRPRILLSGTDDGGVAALHLPLPSMDTAGRIDFGTYGHGEHSSSRAFSSTALIYEAHEVCLRRHGDLLDDDES